MPSDMDNTWGQIYPCCQCNRRSRLCYPKFERDISASSSTRPGSTAWRVGPLGAGGTYTAHTNSCFAGRVTSWISGPGSRWRAPS
jgi:hypothetical protein